MSKTDFTNVADTAREMPTLLDLLGITELPNRKQMPEAVTPCEPVDLDEQSQTPATTRPTGGKKLPGVQGKRAAKRDDGAERVRENREEEKQELGYLAKPFLLCGLPFQKPKSGTTMYERVNGDDVLTIIGHEKYGLPFGGDIQPLIWVSTLAKLSQDKATGKVPRVVEFKSGRDFLRAFDLPEDGPSYKRAQERFLRVFYSTFYWGKRDSKRAKLYRMHFFDEIDLWFTKDLDTHALPGEDFKNNRIKLSEAFAEDLEKNCPPIDMEMVRMWADSPGQLFFGMWLVFRCFVARGESRIPLMGPGSVKEQCGAEGYDGKDGPDNFKRKVKGWLGGVKATWPECPVVVESSPRGDVLVIQGRAKAIHERSKSVDKPKDTGSFPRSSGTEQKPRKR